jgi:hypothetical protein
MNNRAPVDWRSRYPDHHEGVPGRQLDDDLLSLDERAAAHRVATMALCRHLQRATLVGNPAPIVRRMWDRLTRPEVGDLVVETTLGLQFTREHTRAMGYLLAAREEWYESAAEWAIFEAEYPEDAYEDNRATDDAWYIQYGPNPGDVCRWTNCEFMTVPIDPRMFDER